RRCRAHRCVAGRSREFVVDVPWRGRPLPVLSLEWTPPSTAAPRARKKAKFVLKRMVALVEMSCAWNSIASRGLLLGVAGLGIMRARNRSKGSWDLRWGSDDWLPRVRTPKRILLLQSRDFLRKKRPPERLQPRLAAP